MNSLLSAGEWRELIRNISVSGKRVSWIPLITLLLALFLRLGFVWETGSHPEFEAPHPGLDADIYWRAAGYLVEDGVRPVFELMIPTAPLYVYFLHFVRNFLGLDVFGYRILMSFLGACCPPAVFWAGIWLHGSRAAATVAAFLVATMPPLIYYQTIIDKTSLILLLIALLLFAAAALKVVRTLKFFVILVVLGVIAALLNNCYQIGGVIVVVLCVYVVAISARELWWQRALSAATLMVSFFVGSYLIRVLIGGHDLPWQRFWPQEGFNLYLGYHAGAVGTYRPIPEVPSFPYGHTFVSRMAAELAVGHRLSPDGANTYYFFRAIRYFIIVDPADAFGLAWKKFSLFFNTIEPRSENLFYFLETYSAILRLPWLQFGGLVIASFWGCVALLRDGQKETAFLLAGSASSGLLLYVLTIAYWRYRVPGLIPFALMAGYGLDRCFAALPAFLGGHLDDRRARTRMLLMSCATVLGAVFVFRPILDHEYFNLAFDQVRNNERMTIEADDARRRVGLINLNNQRTLEDELERIRLESETLHHYTEAFRHLEQFVDHHQDNAWVNHLYVGMMLYANRYEEARKYADNLRKYHPIAYKELHPSKKTVSSRVMKKYLFFED